MPPTIAPQPRRRVRRAAPLLACVMAVIATMALLGSCSGERASLGSLPPKLPAAASTTTSTTASPIDETLTPTPPGSVDTTPPSVSLALGPNDLLGWIATPVGQPRVHTQPSTEAPTIDIGSKTPAGAPTTFAIVGDASANTASTAEAPGWHQVALPNRPNGSTGWVPESSVTVAKTPFRIFIDLNGRTLRVEDGGTEVFTTAIAIGTSENPTPTNGTFVTELIANTKPDGAYGPYAFGLAMHSDTLSEFGGGNGQVGIHGTNQPQLIGQAVSHGCVRLTNPDVQKLVDLQLPLGVPVFIT